VETLMVPVHVRAHHQTLGTTRVCLSDVCVDGARGWAGVHQPFHGPPPVVRRFAFRCWVYAEDRSKQRPARLSSPRNRHVHTFCPLVIRPRARAALPVSLAVPLCHATLPHIHALHSFHESQRRRQYLVVACALSELFCLICPEGEPTVNPVMPAPPPPLSLLMTSSHILHYPPGLIPPLLSTAPQSASPRPPLPLPPYIHSAPFPTPCQIRRHLRK
jgi:hypothetical protein